MSGSSKKILISKNNLSVILKVLTIISAFAGIILSFICATEEGYINWYIRAAYFTLQSNFWISGLMLFILVQQIIGKRANDNVVYTLKFLFTVSITITFIVFWTLLAPFAHLEDYNPWSWSSVTTHLLAPAFAIIDFFVDEKQIDITKKHVYYSLYPPLAYFIFATVLCLLKVDFGRGDPYPYFFMDYYSPAGLFGLQKEPFVLGTFYYLSLILLVILSVAAVLRAVFRRTKGRKN